MSKYQHGGTKHAWGYQLARAAGRHEMQNAIPAERHHFRLHGGGLVGKVRVGLFVAELDVLERDRGRVAVGDAKSIPGGIGPGPRVIYQVGEPIG